MSIVYIVDKKIFPDNSNCEFKSILPNDFDVKLLCPDKVLLVSVHRICFTVNKPHNLQFISINSDILNDHQFVNNKLKLFRPINSITLSDQYVDQFCCNCQS